MTEKFEFYYAYGEAVLNFEISSDFKKITLVYLEVEYEVSGKVLADLPSYLDFLQVPIEPVKATMLKNLLLTMIKEVKKHD